MPRPKPDITPEKLEAFERMFLAGAHRQEIAEALGLYHDRVKKMIIAMPAAKEKERYRAQIAMRKPTATHFVRSHGREPSMSAIIERDRRLTAPRTLTAELCGDPRPGQSALDKRGAAA